MSKTISEKLDELDVVFIRVDMAGSGDSGGIEDVTTQNSKEESVHDKSLVSAIEYWTLSVTDFMDYNNEGSQGYMEFERSQAGGTWDVMRSSFEYNVESEEQCGFNLSAEAATAFLAKHFGGEDALQQALIRLEHEGVNRVDVKYIGSGDSGGIEDMTEIEDAFIRDKIESAMDVLIESEHPGFENNEGGRGGITLVFKDGVITDASWDASNYMIDVHDYDMCVSLGQFESFIAEPMPQPATGMGL